MTEKNKSLPTQRSSKTDIKQFLSNANQLPQRKDSRQSNSARLLFALDATASRQPTWDRACQLQGEMFLAGSQLGGIQIQLCYYRGINEFHHSPWLDNTQALLAQMSAVQCLGGYTQIARVLDHSIAQQQIAPIQAVVIIADAVEENVDLLCNKAGKLGLLGVPLFMFQEGFDTGVRHCFTQMARLSKGAYAAFDEQSASQLTELLSAVATFASGGYQALQQLQSASAHQLLQQLDT